MCSKGRHRGLLGPKLLVREDQEKGSLGGSSQESFLEEGNGK